MVAKSVGLGSDASGDLVAAAAVALTAHDYLLVLDNCDRVGDVVGELVVELLRAAPSLGVLATSRSPLGSADETVHPLAPLGVEGAEPAAVRLFLDRAAAAGAALTVPDDVSLVREVCQRLDGLPLAIELAAARSRHLPLGELAARLAHGFGALDRGGTGRHSTLAAASPGRGTCSSLASRTSWCGWRRSPGPSTSTSPRRCPARRRPTSCSAWSTARW